jgi:DNA excision repair protein ERCC-4
LPIALTATDADELQRRPEPKRVSDRPLPLPFTVLADDRERAAGWRFAGLRADSRNSYRPLVVPVQYTRLLTGDYTVEGLEELITIERKSLSDLFGSLSRNKNDDARERFKREHERMAVMSFAVVIIEADWPTIMDHPPADSRLHPASVFGTAAAWQQTYGVHWEAMGSRDLAERRALYHLRRFWERHNRQQHSENGKDESDEH